MSLLIPPRYSGEELIDQPGHPYEEIVRALREIEWVNRHLAGWRVLRRCLPRLLDPLPPDRELRVLDLGTGSGDLPRAMARWARERGRRLLAVGVDNCAEVVAFARRECADDPDVRIVQADLFHLPFPPRQFDLVVCSLFLHHFAPAAAVRMLQVMAHNSRHAILVNDLQRHRLAYWAIWLLSRLQRRGRLFRHDAPISVLRAYRAGELRDLLRRAGLQEVVVERVFPFRMAALGPVQAGGG